MTIQAVLSNSDAFRVLQALELFKQTFGKPRNTLDFQAAIGALAITMRLDNDLDELIHQIFTYYQQVEDPTELFDAAKQATLESTIQEAKERLDEQEETLILFVRTYLQRVTSKLSAAEFIDMLQTAITLL
ncbi:MAG: hypothetical protein F6K11_32075, partial [Leptolyngbya sp. SIO3F4]|nr:hypothetical protein [Leptolyngbya sp. SIO3F4]